MSRRLLGAVLAGGRSRRFGSDKGAALLGGRRLIDHAIAGLAPHVAAIVVCGRAIEGVTALADRPAPDLGPLGGLAAALHHAAGAGYEAVLTTGCDMPIFPAESVATLIGEGPAIVAGQQLIGYWPATLSVAIDRHLAAAGDRSIRGWIAALAPRVVPLAGPALPNVNTPADLAALARCWPAESIAGRNEPA